MALLVGAILDATRSKGIATRSKCLTSSNKKLLGAPGLTTRSNRTLLGAKGIATRSKCLTSNNKKLVETSALLVGARTLLGAKGIATRSMDAY